MEIRNIYGAVIFASEESTTKDSVLDAIKSGADLSEADLSGAYLYGADLSGANLSEANLSGANLSGANLSGANLSEAYLSGADLSEANLSEANLSEAYLSGADLSEANLSEANLSGANLSGANLSGAYLYGANLSEANLSGANLSGANLSGAKNAELTLARLQFLPETGSFEAWKKCKNGVIVKLLIPEDAQRSHSAERKARASKVVVLDVIGADFGVSSWDETVVYQKGTTVYPRAFDTDRWHVCAPGIHFFLTRLEAEDFEV